MSSSVNFCAATRFKQAKIFIAAGRTEKAGNGTVVFKMCNMRMSVTRIVHIAGDPCFRQYPCKLCLRAVAFDDCTGIKRQIQWLRLLTLRYEFIILCNHARVNEACIEKTSCRLSAACPDAKLFPLATTKPTLNDFALAQWHKLICFVLDYPIYIVSPNFCYHFAITDCYHTSRISVPAI